MTELQEAQEAQAPHAAKAPKPAQRPRGIPPALEALATHYPALFGAVFRPLKRGIFQDILQAQPDVFESDALKEALAFHTRSTRYLSSVAAGMARHDLQGQAVEDMAPEHVHHALLEVYRRRLRPPATPPAGNATGHAGRRAPVRSPDELRTQLIARMVQMQDASGLSRQDYADLVRSRDESANALLDEAMALAAEAAARDEALLRAFEASGQSLDAFASMYGMESAVAQQTLARAGKRREAVAGI